MVDSEFLQYSEHGRVGELVLHRPPVNALGQTLIRDLQAFASALHTAVENGGRDVRVLILSAEGKHFSAGADLKERSELPEENVAAVVDATRAMVNAVAAIPIPVIAAVQGSALGGGMELALAADFRILATTARMGLRETALAIIPGAGGTQRLPRLIGVSAALYWITTGQIFDARACQRFGVAAAVVSPEALLEEARSAAGLIAANGPLAVRAAKKAVIAGAGLGMEEGLRLEQQCYASIIPTEDRREALSAFRDKRKPVFKGR